MQPLAERLRPQTLDEYIGQKHLVGEGAVIRRMIEQKRVASFILWGPPGVGKTTLANIIAKTLEVPFFTLSAVTSSVKDVREGCGAGYFVEQQFLPDGATDARFWHPQENASENKLHERMKHLWGDRFEQ